MMITMRELSMQERRNNEINKVQYMHTHIYIKLNFRILKLGELKSKFPSA